MASGTLEYSGFRAIPLSSPWPHGQTGKRVSRPKKISPLKLGAA